jgi:hypothetical protein
MTLFTILGRELFRFLLLQEAANIGQYRQQLRENPLHIFISYDSQDSKAVRRLYKKLNAEPEFKPWLDRVSLKPGDAWEDKLSDALKRCDCAVVCLSQRSLRNRGVFRKTELKYIVEKASKELDDVLYIVPVMLEECNMPRLLNRWQASRLYERGGYKKLSDVLVEGYKNMKDRKGIKYKPAALRVFEQ